MAINRKITANRAVQWNGEEAARVRGLTPNDLAVILEREGSGLRAALDVLDDADLNTVDTSDANAVAGALIKVGPQVVVQLSQALPHFLATIIVVAADGDDEDVQIVASEWPLALQFMALTEIAVLTFSGAEGFRDFLGNAYALVGLGKTLTGADKNTGPAAQTPSGGGSIPSSS